MLANYLISFSLKLDEKLEVSSVLFPHKFQVKDDFLKATGHNAGEEVVPVTLGNF